MTSSDNFPMSAKWVSYQSVVWSLTESSATTAQREIRQMFDEIDRLRAQVELAQADADRLAACVRHYPGKATTADRRDALLAHDEAVAQR